MLLVGWQEGHPACKKTEWWGAGVVICVEQGAGLTSMQHATSYTTTAQPSSHNQRHVLIGKQWYQLPELIPTNSNSGLYRISISIHTQHVT